MRFALVMALNYYMNAAYLDEVLALIDGVKLDHYYVKMAVAWAVSFCFIYDPGRTKAYLQNNTLDDFTYRKSLSKILESYRVSPEDKEYIRALRKNKAARLS